MKLHLAGADGAHLFNACEVDHVVIDRMPHACSVIVTRTEVISPWRPTDFNAITADDLTLVLPLGCEILLLGTGARQRFAAPALLEALYRAGIGVEAMSTPAACRTYNILVAEDRKVAAAVVLQ